MEIPSEEITLVDKEQAILSQISPFFQVSETKYGGKGCFSYESIPRGTDILVSKPLGFTISKDFKKEVCHKCFNYDNGKTMKFRLSLPTFKNQSICFCSEKCLSAFKSMKYYEVYLRSLLNLDKLYTTFCTEEMAEVPVAGVSEFIHTIKGKWEQVEQWDASVLKTKPTKWQKLIPKITETEYLEIKYVLGVLHKLYIRDTEEEEPQEKFLSELSQTDAFVFESRLFDLLQSNEISKVLKFKNLLVSYITIFKFIRLTSPPQFQKFINPLDIRLIIGNNLTNAFGIWTLNEGDKDFLGFGVYPSGSFFNHSCTPNIIKRRINNELHFLTLADIQKNDELCIDYGNYLEEPM
ncbi:Histone-lysine N-methyltransferase set-6 [Yamadazyma tenuis]|uniref:Histone-lysine N-methyltransferase set-6 n=1 Tax=Candida tenuis TaxID=2315449 RepID=UPI00279D4069|nr:Histone-lysine N-methyltransferase set-6 [Yamadazyma tenuis]